MNELEQNYLEHHGILGQKWGIRRYQNPDGSLTAAGRKRYGIEGERTAKQTTRRLNDLDQAMAFNVHAHNQADIALKKLSNKAKRKLSKGKELSERDIKKVEKNAKKMAEADAYLKEGQEETKRILDNLPDTMNFTEKPIMRYSQKGLEFITDQTQTIGTPLGTISQFTPMPTYVQGIQYKVKDKSKKQLAEESIKKAEEDHKKEAEIRSKKISETSKEIDNMIKNKEILTEGNIDLQSKEGKKRARESADLGLKALNKIGRDGYDEKTGITNSDRNWFVWEDQTIGLFTVADLVRQGKSKSQIKSMIEAAYDSSNDDKYYSNGYFQLAYLGDSYHRPVVDKFIDACEEELRNK